MVESASSLPFASALPKHTEVIEGLRRQVVASERWRWLELSCSLAVGAGDDLSDIDAGIGFSEAVSPDELNRQGESLVRAAAPVLDLLIHQLGGWPAETRRFAVEYINGIQLDLVLMPSHRRQGLPDRSLPLVDKDGRLETPWRPPVADQPSEREAREWMMLGWWALSDTAKHIARGSLFEAAERLNEARGHMLSLFASARRVPYPSFGLVSLLDFEPFELPTGLVDTYCVPQSGSDVLRAAFATADLLEATSSSWGESLGVELDTAWAQRARRRLTAAATSPTAPRT